MCVNDYAVELLTGTLAIKKQIQDFVVKNGIQNSCVPDIERKMWPDTVTVDALVEKMVGITSAVTVHFTVETGKQPQCSQDASLQEQSWKRHTGYLLAALSGMSMACSSLPSIHSSRSYGSY